MRSIMINKSATRILIALGLLVSLGSTNAVSASTGSHFSIDVQDADLYSVIGLIGRSAGENIVADGSVKHIPITLRLNNVTLKQALDTLTSAYDLQISHKGSVTLIGDSAVMNRRYPGHNDDGNGSNTLVIGLKNASPEIVASALVGALPASTVVVPDHRTNGVVVTGSADILTRAKQIVMSLDMPAGASEETVSIPLSYTAPSDALAVMRSAFSGGGRVSTISYFASDKTNSIVVTGSRDDIARSKKVLGDLDLPGLQVMFEVKVVDVTPENSSSNVGVQFGGVSSSGTNQPNSGNTFTAFTSNTLHVNATLNALVTKGSASLLATPKIMAMNNKEASLLVGQKIPIVFYDAAAGGQQVQYVNAGVQLKFTPSIGENGDITTNLHTSFSQVTGFQQNYPIIGDRSVDSFLRIHDGETIVLAGLLQETTSDTVNKLPILGDIPIFGGIFKNRQRSHVKDEIMFFITPHIINNVVSKPVALDAGTK